METQTMTTEILTGRAAIDYAREHGLRLRKYADPIEDARDDLTPDEADAVAREDASLIYLVPPVTAAEFVNALGAPILRFASTGTPAGENLALLDDVELPFDLSELRGTVKDGRWTWDGDGDPVDFGRNTITAIWICDDVEEFARQQEDYNASI